MLIIPDDADPQGKINPEDIKSPADIRDAAALQITVQDATNTESWIQNNYWSIRWREADALYQAPPGVIFWEGTTVPRANVNRFVVMETVIALRDQVMNGIFYENPPFKLRPRPSQQENTVRAISELLAVELAQMNIAQEVDWGIFSALLFGTGIWKWGFKSYTEEVRKYVPLGETVKVPASKMAGPDAEPIEMETPESLQYVREDEQKPVHMPFFENRDIRYVLVDPGCHVPDIRKAKFVIDRSYATYETLMQMKDEEYVDTDSNGKQKLVKRYNLPSEEEIRSWFTPPEPVSVGPGNTTAISQGTPFVHHAKHQFEKTTEDPLQEPLEILERWDNNKVITVLNRVKCIRNEPNEFKCIPFLSVNWVNIPDAFWGLGLGRVIGVEQRVQAGLINSCLDLASLIVNPMSVVSRGAQVETQQIRQRIGGILQVNGPVKEAFHMLEQPNIPNEIIQQIQMSAARVEKTSGASDQLTMGVSSPGNKGGQMGRSGTGAAGLIQATMNRIGGFAESFIRQVYEPMLYKMHDMNRDKMPISYIREVLGEKLGPEFKFRADDFLNAPAEFEVLAGSHLAAKAQMAQSLFMMIQLFESAPLMDQLTKISNKKVNIEELFHMIHDLSGFKNYYDIIQDMTPQEIQAQAQQLNPQVQKTQAAVALQNNQAQNKSALIDQENEARISRDIFRDISKKSAEPEELSGTPSATQGFGSQEQA